MYRIEFYKDKNGISEIKEYIKALDKELERNKDSRIKYNQIRLQFNLLKEHGHLNLPNTVVKKINNDIYEIRPGDNRILFFQYKDTYVMLNYFRKTTNKTPKQEIDKANRMKDDYMRRQAYESK